MFGKKPTFGASAVKVKKLPAAPALDASIPTRPVMHAAAPKKPLDSEDPSLLEQSLLRKMKRFGN